MKKYYLLSLIAAVFLVGCGEETAESYTLSKKDLPNSILNDPNFSKCQEEMKKGVKQLKEMG